MRSKFSLSQESSLSLLKQKDPFFFKKSSNPSHLLSLSEIEIPSQAILFLDLSNFIAK